LVGHPHAPATSTPGKDPVPIVYEAGLVPGPVWTGGKISSLTGIRSLTVQPVISRYTDWATGSTLYQINFRNGASRWFSLQEYITMHGHLNVEFVSTALLWVKEDTSRRILWPVLKYRSDIECLNVLGVWTLFNFHCAGVGRGRLVVARVPIYRAASDDMAAPWLRLWSTTRDKWHAPKVGAWLMICPWRNVTR